MEAKNYKQILDILPETGVYVIRKDDHRLLYFNQRVKKAAPEASPGLICSDVLSGSCESCPLASLGEDGLNRTLCYSERFGSVVELAAAPILWENDIPAYVIAVISRMETAGYTFRKILQIDLEKDECKVLRTDPEGWQPAENSISEQLERFANSGAIHLNDSARLVAFTRIENLRKVSSDGKNTLSLSYRRRDGRGYRWNLMEVIPDPIATEGCKSAILYVKDVHNMLREGLEREDTSLRNHELIRSLGKQNFDIFTIDLRNGDTVPIRLDGHGCKESDPIAWEELMRTHILLRLHEGYQEEFERLFSLEGLRQAKTDGEEKRELLCQWRSDDEYRYISVSAKFSKKRGSFTVLALQDVDERMRQELAHTKRDMQLASILQTRFKAIDIVDLETGSCEVIDLTKPASPEGASVIDYAEYFQDAVHNLIHPNDIENFWATASLENLRKKAESVEDHTEDICEYRTRREPPAWREIQVIYRRQQGQVMVNILERDITREKLREASQRKVLEDRSDIISSMSSLFFTTYYIDLENDTFRPVNQLRKVGDVLGDEVDCTAALQIYANHFVHPDDREEYLSVMNVAYLRQCLRWWQPYVAVEYRRKPEGGSPDACSWVRATVVLARIGAEDMPATAVYVAQDISGRRYPAEA